MAWTTPRTWVISEVVTAAIMNAQIRDNENYILPSPTFTTYTPTWTATGTNPSIVNGTLTGRYYQIGKQVTVQISLKFGFSDGMGTGAWRFSLPVTAVTGFSYVGAAAGYDASATQNVPMHVVANSTTTIKLLGSGGTSEVSGTSPIAWSGIGNPPTLADYIDITYIYEAA